MKLSINIDVISYNYDTLTVKVVGKAGKLQVIHSHACFKFGFWLFLFFFPTMTIFSVKVQSCCLFPVISLQFCFEHFAIIYFHPPPPPRPFLQTREPVIPCVNIQEFYGIFCELAHTLYRQLFPL